MSQSTLPPHSFYLSKYPSLSISGAQQATREGGCAGNGLPDGHNQRPRPAVIRHIRRARLMSDCKEDFRWHDCLSCLSPSSLSRAIFDQGTLSFRLPQGRGDLRVGDWCG